MATSRGRSVEAVGQSIRVGSERSAEYEVGRCLQQTQKVMDRWGYKEHWGPERGGNLGWRKGHVLNGGYREGEGCTGDLEEGVRWGKERRRVQRGNKGHGVEGYRGARVGGREEKGATARG